MREKYKSKILGCQNTNQSPFLDSQHLGGLWIIVTAMIIIACFFQIGSIWINKKKTDKRRKSLSLFAINSPSNPDIKKKYKEPYLTVDDYVHIPDRGLSNFIETELKGFIFIYFYWNI